MDRAEIENVSQEVEMLARMWLICDPNRDSNPDEPSQLHINGIAEDQPRWKWFIPRAQASLKFFESHGFALTERI